MIRHKGAYSSGQRREFRIQVVADILYLLQTRRCVSPQLVSDELSLSVRSARRYLAGISSSRYPVRVDRADLRNQPHLYSLPDDHRIRRAQ